MAYICDVRVCMVSCTQCATFTYMYIAHIKSRSSSSSGTNNRSHHYRESIHSFISSSISMHETMSFRLALRFNIEKKASRFPEEKHTFAECVLHCGWKNSKGGTRENSISISSFSFTDVSMGESKYNMFELTFWVICRVLTKRCQNEYIQGKKHSNKKMNAHSHSWHRLWIALHQFPRTNYTLLNKYSCCNFLTHCLCVSECFGGMQLIRKYA